MPRVTAFRGDDQEIIAVRHVHQRGCPTRSAPGSDVIEQQQRREAWHPPANPAACRAVERGMATHQRAEQEPQAVGDVEVVDGRILGERLEPIATHCLRNHPG